MKCLRQHRSAGALTFIIHCCIATPRADKTASLRAFAKAGFALVRSIRTADGDVEMLMARNRDAVRES